MTEKKLEKDNPKIALNVLYVKKWKYILPSFQNTKQTILLMISNGEAW